MNILIMPDTMILYRFFFEWLESKNHPLSTFRWQDIIDTLSDNERQTFIDSFNADCSSVEEKCEFMKDLAPFYKNLRDEIALPNGSLYELKVEFDRIPKSERDNILFELKQNYQKDGCRKMNRVG